MRRKPNPDSEANIRRIDTKSRADKQTHGFQVHFMRRTSMATKMFSDGVYGGKDKARRAARKFRNAAIGDLPEPEPSEGGKTFERRIKKQAASI
jgi:hypothetical protein